VLSSRNWFFSTVTTVAIATMSAASLHAQATATICTDGTTSVSSGRGACSGHGGVNRKAVSHQKKIVKSETKAAKAAEKRTAITPRVSANARARASTNSSVVAGSGAAEDNNPVGAIARCKDGLYSHARHRRGACGHHGGVASWL
jgi:hypothetical protein